jgi:hypothetical protein
MSKPMTEGSDPLAEWRAEIDVLIGIAASWGENQEESMAHGRDVGSGTTDAECEALAADDDESWDGEDYRQLRDLWRAVDRLSLKCEHRDDGKGCCAKCGASLVALRGFR